MAYDPLGGKAIPVIFIDAADLVENAGTYTLDKGPYMALLAINAAPGSGGATALAELTDVNTSTPTLGNILRADGVDWESVPLTDYALLHTDFSGADGILRKTSAGVYEVVKVNFAATAAPAVTDDSGDGYAVGSVWIDVTNDAYYVCVDASVGAAVWLDISSGSGGGTSMTYAQTVELAVANTTDESTLMSAGRGTKFIAANTVEQGTSFRIVATGFLGTTGTPTLNLKAYLGATEICATTAITMGSGLSNVGFRLVVNGTFRDTGATGVLVASGYFERDDGSIKNLVKLTETTIDTTAILEVILTATWGAANAANTITCQTLNIEILSGTGLAPVGPTELGAVEL